MWVGWCCRTGPARAPRRLAVRLNNRSVRSLPVGSASAAGARVVEVVRPRGQGSWDRSTVVRSSCSRSGPSPARQVGTARGHVVERTEQGGKRTSPARGSPTLTLRNVTRSRRLIAVDVQPSTREFRCSDSIEERCCCGLPGGWAVGVGCRGRIDPRATLDGLTEVVAVCVPRDGALLGDVGGRSWRSRRRHRLQLPGEIRALSRFSVEISSNDELLVGEGSPWRGRKAVLPPRNWYCAPRRRAARRSGYASRSTAPVPVGIKGATIERQARPGGPGRRHGRGAGARHPGQRGSCPRAPEITPTRSARSVGTSSGRPRKMSRSSTSAAMAQASGL